MKAVKFIILQMRRYHEKTIGPVAAYVLAKIINPLAQGSDVEGDEIVFGQREALQPHRVSVRRRLS